MCGRFSITKTEEEIETRFSAKFKEKRSYRKWNSSPQNELPIITSNNTESIVFYKWGLVPSWAKSDSIGFNTINARIETLAEKPAFKNAYEKQHCLVLADGYYEWKKIGKEKIPYRIVLPSRSLFTMAGLWEKWIDPTGNQVYTFTVITRDSVGKMKEIHERMPVILPSDQEKNWLRYNHSFSSMNDFLTANSLVDLDFYTVSQKVNSVKNDVEDLIQPFHHHVQGTLF